MSRADLIKGVFCKKSPRASYAEDQTVRENPVRPDPVLLETSPQEDPPLPFSRAHADATCRDDRGLEVLFTDPQTGNQKVIVNRYGYFVDFPGIEIAEEEGTGLSLPVHCVELGVDFSFFGSDKYLVVWQVQMADVFLCSLIDQKGDFLFPFRLYQVGMKKFFWQKPVIRFRKKPNTKFVEEERFVEWMETEADWNASDPILRIPMPRVYIYEAEHGFYVDGRVYESIQDLRSREEGEEHIYRDIYDRRVMEVYERFPCFDAYDYAYENRYYRWFYLVSGNKLWRVYQEDGRDRVWVTEDAAQIDATIWRNMKRFGLVEDVELYSLAL